MKTKLTLIMMLMAAATGAWAQDMIMTLVVTMKNQQTHEFALTDRPQVRFEGDQLVVQSDRTVASFPMADVLRFHYEKQSYVGIYEPEDDTPELRYEGGVLIISGIKAGETAAIYASDGRLVRQLDATRTGTYRLSLASLSTGVYIVRTGKTNYKITKR